jgi:hypothetical protein
VFSKNEPTLKQGDDLRSNHFEEKGNEVNQRASPKDPLKIPIRPITRSKT